MVKNDQINGVSDFIKDRLQIFTIHTVLYSTDYSII